MTLREILKQRAQRRKKLAESKRTSPRFPGRRTRRETVEERKMNRFIESRERMNRKHYVLVEDENNDDLVEIDSDDTDDTSIDTSVDTGSDVSKDEIIKSLEELAAQVGMKVVPADDADAVNTDDIEGDDATADDTADESNAAAATTDQATTDISATTDPAAQPPSNSTTAVTNEADKDDTDDTEDTDADAGDVPAATTDDAEGSDNAEGDEGTEGDDAEGDEGTEGDDAEGDEGTEGSDDGIVPTDTEEKEEAAKTLAELKPEDWFKILAEIEKQNQNV